MFWLGFFLGIVVSFGGLIAVSWYVTKHPDKFA